VTSGSERLLELLWESLPRRAGVLGSWPRRALSDGIYLTAWPKLAAFGALACCGLGALVGALHPGFETVYSESPVALLISGVLGALSAQLGLGWTLGYALGDLLLGRMPFRPGYGTDAADVLCTLGGLLLAYFLLSMLTVFMPLFVTALRRRLQLPARTPRALRLALEPLLFAASCATLAYLWSVAVPVLIRPVFTWRGSNPPVAAMSFLQQRGVWLAAVVAAAAAARIALEARVMRSTERRKRVMRHVLRLRAAGLARRSHSRHLAAVLAAACGTLLLAGALTHWLDAALLAGFLLFINLVQRGLLVRLPDAWLDRVERVPLLLRLLAVAGGTWLVARWLVPAFWHAGGDTFRPVVLCVAASFTLSFLLCPAPRSTASEEGR